MRQGDFTSAVEYLSMTHLARAWWLLAQVDAGNAEGGNAAGGGSLFDTILANPLIVPVIIILPLMYFMLILPEKRKRAQTTSMLDNLKKNDRIVTIGGIVGKVVNVTQGAEEVTILADENSNTRMRVLRSAISRVLTEEDSSAKKDT